MVFAFRIVNCFFCMGPKILFQVGLAVLKINGEKPLQVQDDGGFVKWYQMMIRTREGVIRKHSSDKLVHGLNLRMCKQMQFVLDAHAQLQSPPVVIS